MPNLDNDEIQALVQFFAADGKWDSDHCNWRKFCNAIDPQCHLEQDPDLAPSRVCQSHVRRTSFSPLDREAALKKIRDLIDEQRMHLKPAFQDFDKSRCRCVNLQKFHTVCDMFKIKEKARLSEDDLANLAISYQVISRNKGLQYAEINYHEFCKDVDPRTEVS